MSLKHKKKIIHGSCQSIHGLGWLAMIPNPFFKVLGEPFLDLLLGIGISIGIGIVIQKITKS